MSRQAPKAAWVFTHNNYTDAHVAAWKEYLTKECKLAVFEHEVGEEGTPHLQGYFSLNQKKRFEPLRNELIAALSTDGIHLEPAKGSWKQNHKYCTKHHKEHGGPFEPFVIGDPPKTSSKRCKLSAMCESVTVGHDMKTIAELDPPTYVRNYRGIAAYRALQQSAFTSEDVRGLWFYGAPGTGKSHLARDVFGLDLFLKSQNKWWDGYDGEHAVLLDDLDTVALNHLIKIWADKYACTGEIKGGTVKLNHRYFVVTSNYTIDELCTRNKIDDDDPVREALKRRFHTYECKHEFRYLDENNAVPSAERQRFCVPEFNPDDYPMVDRFAGIPDTILITGSETSSELREVEGLTIATEPTERSGESERSEESEESDETEENEF